ncbi:MAG: S8/S53 family peptidase [Deltaproteobacteria bacterium]
MVDTSREFTAGPLDSISVYAESTDDVRRAIEAEAPGAELTRDAYQPDTYDLDPGGDLTRAEAWDLAHRLNAHDGVSRAEPAFLIASNGEALDPAMPIDDDDRDWAFRLIDLDPQGPVGHGIRIAHPDSGYGAHLELEGALMDLESAYDYVEPDRDPKDEGKMASHGTATASVIVSPRESPARLLGVAPGATLVPFRVTKPRSFIPAPVLFWSGAKRLRQAIDAAVRTECDVISISLGWFKNRGLHKAIRNAVDAGLIVVAASGNYTQIVVWPAQYDEVISIGGCSADRTIWWGSAGLGPVDAVGPSDNVWRAHLLGGYEAVAPSDGTSYGTAMTAGLAALWLERHGGRAHLRQTYPHQRVQELFRRALKATATPGRGVFGDFGAGIVNAARLLGPEGDPSQHLEDSVFETAKYVRATSATTLVQDELEFRILTDPQLREGVARTKRLQLWDDEAFKITRAYDDDVIDSVAAQDDLSPQLRGYLGRLR